jgi:hypothetical protein
MNELAFVPVREIDRYRGRALWLGVAGLLLSVLVAFFNPTQFFRSYLFGFLFWLGVALGCLAVLMIHHLTGGGWGLGIRRSLEAATRTFPLLAILFLPLLLGRQSLFIWARADEVAHSELLQHKALYLNWPFFLIRATFYFIAWVVLSHYLNKWSLEQDQKGDPRTTRWLQLLSGPGLVLFGLTVTFASIDWVMSLDPEWFSTLFGMAFMEGQALTGVAFIIAVAALLSRYEPLSRVFTPSHFHDLGKLLLAFVMIWAYLAFSQFLIIWSGNLPEEIPWYVRRLQGGWQWVGLGLVLFHFGLPFLLLLSRSLKRSADTLVRVAWVVLFMRLVDLYWLIAPELQRGGWHLHWLDLVAPLGVGGLWLAFFFQQLKNRPLLALNDPGLKEAMAAVEK